MDINIGSFITGMALGPAATLVCPFLVVPWLVVLHLSVRKRNPLCLVDVYALFALVLGWSLNEAVHNRMTDRCLDELFFAGMVWSFGFVIRIGWSLRFKTGRLLTSFFNGVLPFAYLLAF